MAVVIIPGPETDQSVEELNSTYLEFDVLDPNDATGNTKVPGSALTTGLLTLYNKADTANKLIDALDVKASLDANGHFKHLLPGSVNVIVIDGATVAYEDHVAVVTMVFTAGGDTHNLVKSIRVRVINQQFIS